MPDTRRSTVRRTARRRSNSRITAVVVVAAVVAVAVAVFALAWTRLAGPAHTVSRTTAPSSKQAAKPRKPSSANAATAKSGSSSDTPSGSTQASASGDATPSHAQVVAASASTAAARRAAVPFPGAPPLPASTKSVNHVNVRHKYVAITLDDGYGFQTKMLDLLEQYDAHCTTFLIGSWAAHNRPILTRLNKDGFEIGNHTWDHKPLTKMTTAQMVAEFGKTQAVISAVTKNQAPYMRPPGGASNTHVHQVAASKGYRVVMWNRTFGDSGRGATPEKLYQNAMVSGGGVKPGDIILCHWGSKMSYEAMKRVLPELKAQGYEIVTISELLADAKPAK